MPVVSMAPLMTLICKYLCYPRYLYIHVPLAPGHKRLTSVTMNTLGLYGDHRHLATISWVCRCCDLTWHTCFEETAQCTCPKHLYYAFENEAVLKMPYHHLSACLRLTVFQFTKHKKGPSSSLLMFPFTCTHTHQSCPSPSNFKLGLRSQVDNF